MSFPKAHMLPRSRNANIDILRAAAICSVVSYHMIQMSPVPLPQVMRYADYGAYGVDLFFVLSGWLIGGLYWTEIVRFGNVELFRFWVRRWIRTIPPYLVALGISWLAVFIERHQSFDFGYLFFLQNYYREIPFFLISWSLCIEEHFYLALPFLLFVSQRHKLAVIGIFVVLFLTSPLCRLWIVTSLDSFINIENVRPVFGYAETATHLRLEGLILGFGLAYFPIYLPKQFDLMARHSLWLAVLSIFVFVITRNLSTTLNYTIGFTLLSLGLAAILVGLVSSKNNWLTSSKVVRAIAIASYSAYLTHALMIHVARTIVSHISASYWILYFPITIVTVVIVAALFYWTVEWPAIRIRDENIPRRLVPGERSQQIRPLEQLS